MNEQMQEALARLISLATDGMEGAVSFAQAEIPDVLQQLLMWKLLESAFYAVTGVLLIGLALYLVARIKHDRRKAQKAYEAGEEWTRLYHESSTTSATYDVIALGAAHIIGAIALTAVGTLMFNLTWLQIWVAPKLYLLEYAAKLVK